MNIQLTPGLCHILELDPADLLIGTKVQVRVGETYHLQADGKWRDANFVVDADGWTLPGFGWLRRYNRVRGANWFALIACIGQNLHTARVVGRSQVISITPHDLPNAESEVLTVFANDWPSKYGNNRRATVEEGGPMRLTITRLC